MFFRRTSPQITNQGGLWDESVKIYPRVGGEPKEYKLEWQFPSGAQISFRHLEHEKNVLDWHGAQIPLICWDELTHFTKQQFVYMLSRNRSTCGVRPYVRATTNPDSDSWVAELIDWWIGEDGYAIKERSGVIRYMAVVDDKWEWGDTEKELYDRFPHLEPGKDIRAKTFTFIAATLEDNPILEEIDPGYRANLMAQNSVDRERLLKGNWKIRKESGTMFWRSCFQYEIEDGIGSPVWKIHPSWVNGKKVEAVRAWDFAATDEDGDFTAGVLMVKVGDSDFYVVDLVHGQWKTADRNREFERAISRDLLNPMFDSYTVWVERESGSSGIDAMEGLLEKFPAFPIKHQYSTGKKSVRADNWSTACQNRMVRIINAPWNERFITEHEAFPPKTKRGHDDIVDACSLAFNKLREEGLFATLNRPLLLITPEEEAAYQFEKNAKPLSPEQQFWDYLERQDRASGEVGRVEFPDFL